MPQTPTIGQIVHYCPANHERWQHLDAACQETETWAALVTAIDWDGSLSLVVYWPDASGIIGKTFVRGADEPTPGHWNWLPST